ncbi:MAG: cellulase family glycosylhydrolase [Euryarchaeota archaeon]|nr:cellulase family glycosylhydrolase [Euryarchaeota archaeon]MDE1835150.1 cellulase family glycosylhydrolase [Euryarchaeota archaeon]MDE1881457.1 cellulase family glycosylhydrolase [Euryarchaeota archaeon]MDE2046201.1 cellulase family glycosylhydrolase [Thermoplasmata archaeon]
MPPLQRQVVLGLQQGARLGSGGLAVFLVLLLVPGPWGSTSVPQVHAAAPTPTGLSVRSSPAPSAARVALVPGPSISRESQAPVLPWLHAETGWPSDLVSSDGTYLPLRGVNPTGFIQYGPDWNESVPLSPSDFVEMRALGIDFVRMSLSWSLLEPSPGVFNASYLQAVQQAVGWGAENGVYSLIDMHQDEYGWNTTPPGIEQDGAPPWATLSGNAAHTCPVVGGSPYCPVGPAVVAAFNAFWNNTTVPGYVGLWEAYGEALHTLASTFANDPAVVGYDIMNEPYPGSNSPFLGFCPNGSPVTYVFGDCYLLPFYRAMIPYIRSADTRHAIWFEPPAYTDNLNWAAWNPVSLGDSDLVYEPHIYSDVFTTGANWSGNTSAIQSAFANEQYNAQEFGTAWFVGEYGVNPDFYHDSWIEANLNFSAGRFDVGSSFWEWKSNTSGSSITEPGGGWGLLMPNGSLRTRTDRAQVLASPHAVGGDGLREVSSSFGFRPAVYSLEVNATRPGAWVEVNLPSFWYPEGYQVSGTMSSFAASNSSWIFPGGTRFVDSLLNVTFSGKGIGWLNVTPSGSSQGWLVGNVTPTSAQVEVNGRSVPVLGGNFSLAVPSGTVEVQATAPGYTSQIVSVAVPPGSVTPLTITLLHAPSELRGSVSPTNSSVELDGYALTMGLGGTFLWNGSAGTHALFSTHPGYAPIQRAIDLAPGETLWLNLSLVPGPSWLAGTVAPMGVGATVRVDGLSVAVSSSGGYNLSLSAGPYEVSVGASGYRTTWANVTLWPGRTTGWSAVLAPLPSTSAPPGTGGRSVSSFLAGVPAGVWLVLPVVLAAAVVGSFILRRRRARPRNDLAGTTSTSGPAVPAVGASAEDPGKTPPGSRAPADASTGVPPQAKLNDTES